MRDGSFDGPSDVVGCVGYALLPARLVFVRGGVWSSRWPLRRS